MNVRQVALLLLLNWFWNLPHPLAAEEPVRRPLQPADLFEFKRVEDPQISPEGDWIAYTVNRADLEEDEYESRLWMSPAAGGEAIPMTSLEYSSSRPRWSPDGKYLAFLSERGEEEVTQVWGLRRQGGEAQQLTFVPQGVTSYEWSPDGSRLLLVLQDPKPEDLKPEKPDKEQPKPIVIDRLQFKLDEEGYLDRRRTHLFVATPGEKPLTQLTFGDYDDSQPAWSPDGKQIAFVSNRTDNPDGNSNTDIWIVSSESSEREQTPRRLTDNPGADEEPAWSPDGQRIAYTTVLQPELIWYATTFLAIAPAGGGQPTVLTRELDRHVSNPRFAADGISVYFLLEDSAERHLAHIDCTTRTIERAIAGARSVTDYSLNPRDRIAALVGDPLLPDEVFVWDGGMLNQVSHVNTTQLNKVQLAEVENIHFPSRDGTEIEGFLVKPIGYSNKQRYPTLLLIHGGPVEQFEFSFDKEAQIFAARGYVVLMINPRGSSGYGQEFSMGIWQAWGEKDYEDVMAGVDYAIEKGYSDPGRLGVGGWSYGGILTNYVITKTDRFKAAITGASEVLYPANYGHDHYQLQWELELGLPWENRELWEKLSPFNSVEKIVTPTLIMGGKEDWNVPIHNSEQLYQALKRLGRTTQLVVYPGEHHDLTRPSFRLDRLERSLEWYRKYVQSE